MTPADTRTAQRPSGPPEGAVSSAPLVRTLTLTVFLQWLGATAIVPMLPVYVRNLGGTDGLAGLVMAAFFAAGVLTQYPMGRLADRIGRRPVLIGGLLTYSVASFAFLAPVGPVAAVGLRALQGLGAGAATVASLAAIAASVAVERRGRAFAAVYGGELAGMAVGPLVGSIAGAAHMHDMFVVSGAVAAVACLPARRVVESSPRAAGGRSHRAPLVRLRLRRSAVGAIVTAATLGLAGGVYDICWTLLLLSRGASGWEIGVSWTLFAVPFLLAARPSGWLADHMDRRVLVVAGVGLSTVFCAAYPFLTSVPLLVALGALEALGFAACLPAVQSLLTEGSTPDEAGRMQGIFATSETAFTALAAAVAGAAFAIARWLPFVAVATTVAAALVAVVVIWSPVPGRVRREIENWPEAVAAPLPVWSESIQVAAPDTGTSVDVQ